MSKVVARFRCSAVREVPLATGEPSKLVSLSVVDVHGSGEGKPDLGVIAFHVTNGDAFAAFEQGREYFVSFDPVSDPVSASAALQSLVINKKAA